MKDFNLREYLKNNPLLKEEEDIDYDVIVDELENHVETFKQIAGMGEESRPYFTVTPDEYIEYMASGDIINITETYDICIIYEIYQIYSN